MTIHWTVAVGEARKAPDVSYEEWCCLYVNQKKPEDKHILAASHVAKEILVRNGLIDPGVAIELTGI